MLRAKLFVGLMVVLAAAAVRADEPDVVRRVEALHGSVTHDDKQPGRPIIAVNLEWEIPPSADDIKALATLKGLRRLTIGNRRVPSDALKELEELAGLRELYLTGGPVTDAELPLLWQPSET